PWTAHPACRDSVDDVPMETMDEFADRHPEVAGLLAPFEYTHLPEHIRDVAAPIGQLARDLVRALPGGPELAAGLRNLLDARGCFIRALPE
uniref:hypothetical protein n=1 Tax=Frankia sp. CIT1 TaxID=2880974 RepID=UPI001EF66A03